MDSVEIDMALQKVIVTGYADQKKVLKTVRKTGRRAEIWQLPYNPELRNHNYNNAVYAFNQHHYNGPSTYYAPQPSGSSYNYYKHGYTISRGSSGNYARYMPQSSSIFGHQTGAAFSDENTNACFIM